MTDKFSFVNEILTNRELGSKVDECDYQQINTKPLINKEEIKKFR